jgi:hypothetical protein
MLSGTARPAPTPAAKLSTHFEFCNDLRIRRASFYVDYTWARMSKSPQGFPEELLGCDGISMRCEKEIDAVSLGIDRAI